MTAKMAVACPVAFLDALSQKKLRKLNDPGIILAQNDDGPMAHIPFKYMQISKF